MNLKHLDNIIHDVLLSPVQHFDSALAEVHRICQDEDLPWLDYCISENLMRWYEYSQPRESDIYDWVRENIRDILDDKTDVVSHHDDRRHKPDLWLSRQGNLVPVECKLHDFDNKALQQLQRYIGFYGCHQGIAIARRLTCGLPSNITFIQYPY